MKKNLISAALAANVCTSALLANVNMAGTDLSLYNPEPLSGVIVPDRIYLANESRFVDAHFSEPLTTFAMGWKDPSDLQSMLDFVAPVVNVGHRFEYAEFVNAEEFLSDTVDDSDIRAIGAEFKRVEYTGKKTLGKTFNKGLTIRVDADQVKDQPNWQEVKTGRLMRRLLRNEVRRAIAKISASATNAAKTWASGSPNPDGDVRLQLLTAANASGMRPNRVLYGDTAWDTRVTACEASNTPLGYAAAGRDPARQAAYLNVDEVRISRERYQSTASAKAEVLGSLVFLFNALSGADEEDASNIKRFVSPVEGGGNFRVFVQQVSAKLTDITVEHYSDIVITSTLGLRKVTVS